MPTLSLSLSFLPPSTQSANHGIFFLADVVLCGAILHHSPAVVDFAPQSRTVEQLYTKATSCGAKLHHKAIPWCNYVAMVFCGAIVHQPVAVQLCTKELMWCKVAPQQSAVVQRAVLWYNFAPQNCCGAIMPQSCCGAKLHHSPTVVYNCTIEFAPQGNCAPQQLLATCCGSTLHQRAVVVQLCTTETVVVRKCTTVLLWCKVASVSYIIALKPSLDGLNYGFMEYLLLVLEKSKLEY